MLWEMGAQPRYDGLFGALIGLRYDVDFPFVTDLHRAIEFLKQDTPRFARRFNRHFEKWIHCRSQTSLPIMPELDDAAQA
jgi:hypothetical protein